jgi:hypothetical protein
MGIGFFPKATDEAALFGFIILLGALALLCFLLTTDPRLRESAN